MTLRLARMAVSLFVLSSTIHVAWNARAELSAAEISDRTLLEKNLQDMAAELRERTARYELMRSGVPLKRIPNEQIPLPIRKMSFEELLAGVQSRHKVIYGEDNRTLIHRVTDPKVLELARSAVALIPVNQMTKQMNGTWKVGAETFGERFKLCNGERFHRLPSVADCSGFLVAPDVVATAGHCVRTASHLNQFLFVFDFITSTDNQTSIELNDDQVYEAASLIDRQEDGTGADWAIVKLSRMVKNRTPAQVRRSGKIRDDQRVYAVGHPSGLPMVYTPGAAVRDNAAESFFVANLDTYGGNSGSMVVNADDHKVEGILVRGEDDFVTDGNCYRSLVCPSKDCRGEDVTRIKEAIHVIPPAAALLSTR